MPAPQDQQIPVGVTMNVTMKAVTDGVMAIVTAGAAFSAYLKDSKSYEVLFLCGLLFLLWLYIRKLSSDLAAVKAAQEACEIRSRQKEAHFDSYVEVTNVSNVNMFGDLVAVAGQRRVGHMERDKETGAMVYIRNTSIPPVGPGDADRRGSMISSGT